MLQMIASLRRDKTALLVSADAARTERDIVTEQLEDLEITSQSLISLVFELSSRLRSLKPQQLAVITANCSFTVPFEACHAFCLARVHLYDC